MNTTTPITRSTRRLVAALAAAVALLALGAAGAAPAHAANGCGSGMTASLVPDNVPTAFNFRAACNEHDGCYARWQAGKANCDSEFLRDMRAHCNTRPINQRVSCHGFANAYWAAVNRLGGNAYNNAQHQTGLNRRLTVAIWSAPSGRLSRLNFSIGNGFARTVSCTLDGRAVAPCFNGMLITVRPGMHTIRVTAANNAGAVTASAAWLAR
jgi:hypothetical protein